MEPLPNPMLLGSIQHQSLEGNWCSKCSVPGFSTGLCWPALNIFALLVYWCSSVSQCLPPSCPDTFSSDRGSDGGLCLGSHLVHVLPWSRSQISSLLSMTAVCKQHTEGRTSLISKRGFYCHFPQRRPKFKALRHVSLVKQQESLL